MLTKVKVKGYVVGWNIPKFEVSVLKYYEVLSVRFHFSFMMSYGITSEVVSKSYPQQ